MSANSPYDTKVTEFRAYEHDEGDCQPHDAPRDIANEFFGIGNGRAYSAAFVARGLTIGISAIMSMMRFRVTDETGKGITYIGREIMLKSAISPDLLADIIVSAKDGKSDRKHPITILTDYDGKITVWFTQTGKITYHGKPYNGDCHIKSTQPKQYKRNRTNRF